MNCKLREVETTRNNTLPLLVLTNHILVLVICWIFLGEPTGLFEDSLCSLRVSKFNRPNFEYLKSEACETFGLGAMDTENKLNSNDVEYLKVPKVRFFPRLVHLSAMT